MTEKNQLTPHNRKIRKMLRSCLETAFGVRGGFQLSKYKKWNDIESFANETKSLVYVFEDTTFHLIGDSLRFLPREFGNKLKNESKQTTHYLYFEQNRFYYLGESPMNEFVFLLDTFFKSSTINSKTTALMCFLRIYSIEHGFPKQILAIFDSFLKKDEFLNTVLTFPHFLKHRTFSTTLPVLKISLQPNNHEVAKDFKLDKTTATDKTSQDPTPASVTVSNFDSTNPNPNIDHQQRPRGFRSSPINPLFTQPLDMLASAAELKKVNNNLHNLPTNNLLLQQQPEEQHFSQPAQQTISERKRKRSRIFQLSEDQKDQIMETDHQNGIYSSVIYKQGDIIFYQIRNDVVKYHNSPDSSLRKAIVVRTILKDGSHTDVSPLSDDLIWGYSALRYHNQTIETSPTTISKKNIRPVFNIGTIVTIKGSTEKKTIIGITNNSQKFTPLDVHHFTLNQIRYELSDQKNEQNSLVHLRSSTAVQSVQAQDIEKIVKLQKFKILPSDPKYQKLQDCLAHT